jgi:hypothetical protein
MTQIVKTPSTMAPQYIYIPNLVGRQILRVAVDEHDSDIKEESDLVSTTTSSISTTPYSSRPTTLEPFAAAMNAAFVAPPSPTLVAQA